MRTISTRYPIVLAAILVEIYGLRSCRCGAPSQVWLLSCKHCRPRTTCCGKEPIMCFCRLQYLP